MTSGFVNRLAKVFLTGADTHAADLTGSAVQVNDSGVGSSAGGNASATTSRPTRTFFSNGSTILSVVDTTPANSTVIVTICYRTSLTGNGGNSELTIGGAQVLTFSTPGAGGTGFQQYVDVDPPAGSNTYAFKSLSSQQLESMFLVVKFISLDDTHAATLTGSNTQQAAPSKTNGMIGG